MKTIRILLMAALLAVMGTFAAPGLSVADGAPCACCDCEPCGCDPCECCGCSSCKCGS
jgi:hypothetical protein